MLLQTPDKSFQLFTAGDRQITRLEGGGNLLLRACSFPMQLLARLIQLHSISLQRRLLFGQRIFGQHSGVLQGGGPELACKLGDGPRGSR